MKFTDLSLLVEQTAPNLNELNRLMQQIREVFITHYQSAANTFRQTNDMQAFIGNIGDLLNKCFNKAGQILLKQDQATIFYFRAQANFIALLQHYFPEVKIYSLQPLNVQQAIQFSPDYVPRQVSNFNISTTTQQQYPGGGTNLMQTGPYGNASGGSSTPQTLAEPVLQTATTPYISTTKGGRLTTRR